MDEPKVKLRRIPYPYRAMLAICSDLDETPDRHVYSQIMRFLNTPETTAMGPGVDLEVGNSIYFDMPDAQFAYWNTGEIGRDMIRTLIRSGHIDCLHSYGDLARQRCHAGRALDELARHDCRLEVWIDHAAAPTNFGSDIMQGHGDERGHEAYHADLTIGHGIRYVWRGRVTSMIGQNTPASLGGLWTPVHPVVSARTVAKEAAKHLLARCGHPQYAMHGPNRVLQPARLRDRQSVYEFLRCNPHWGGVSCCETGRGIGQVLTNEMLHTLASREGVCILYTHLGRIHSYDTPFDPRAVAGFVRLAQAQHGGRILVTTTRRLLRYCRMLEEVSFTVSSDAEGLWIDVTPPKAAAAQNGHPWSADLDGLTFYVSDRRAVRVTVTGRPVAAVRRNERDHRGMPSVSFPWPRLEFPL